MVPRTAITISAPTRSASRAATADTFVRGNGSSEPGASAVCVRPILELILTR